MEKIEGFAPDPELDDDASLDAAAGEPLAIGDILKQESERQVQTIDGDTELFNRFLTGDDKAYQKLYDAYERPLYVYCCRLLTSEVEAQDIFQDIWIRMFKLRGEKLAVKKFSGLLFTVARNLCLNQIRNRKPHSHLSLDDMPLDAQASLRSVDFEEADLREMMQKALMQLPFNQREAFILREYSGYSYQEIAEIMGSSMINVKTRAWRARERLRKIVSAWLDLKHGA